MANRFSGFSSLTPHGTSLMLWQAVGHDAKRACHCRVFSSYFFGSHTPSKSAELITIIDFFIRINKNVFTIGIKESTLKIPFNLEMLKKWDVISKT
jgi:hypothetical protein